MKECVTHHYACDCREEAHRKEVARLTRERDEARATERLWKVCELAYPEEGWTVLEATTAEEAQRQYESSCGGRPDGIEPDEEWLTATPFTLEDLEAMDVENERLRGALERAERALQGIATAQRFNRDVFSDDSAYVDWARSLSLHAAEIARAALAKARGEETES